MATLMFYEVRANLYFSSQDEADDFYHDCEVALPKATVVNPGTPEQECSTIELLFCRHDEHPLLPCSVLEKADDCPVPPEPV